MRNLIVYSSRTGNTKTIAEAIYAIMPHETVLVAVEDAPNPNDFDLICLGYWVDKGMPDPAMATYMACVEQKLVGLFGTLGAWPDSDHAKKCMEKAAEMVAENTVLGNFICQGKIDPKLLAAMEKNSKQNNAHPMTEDRKARIEEAKQHPNAQDCTNAQRYFATILDKAQAHICAK